MFVSVYNTAATNRTTGLMQLHNSHLVDLMGPSIDSSNPLSGSRSGLNTSEDICSCDK